MVTFQPTPTYYRVTWNLTSPTDYTGTGTTAGGISPYTSNQYHTMVALTSYNATPTMTTGDTLSCNGYIIGPFDSGDNVAAIVDRFNLMNQYTNVMASVNFSGYVTLQSAWPQSTLPIVLANVNGTPLTTLGFPVGAFSYKAPIYGGTFTTLGNTDTVVINGATITFTTAGGLNPAGACSTINAVSGVTGVVATRYAGNIQLNSLSLSPIYIGADTGAAASDLGFAASTVYVPSMTFAQATAIEQGNMRWTGVASYIESNLTATVYGATAMTGTTTSGNTPPTTVSWTVGIEHIDQLVTYTVAGEPEAVNTQLVGPAAMERLIARALTSTWISNRSIWNSNVVIAGGTVAYNDVQVVTQQVTAAAIDIASNVAVVEANLSVTQIAYA